MGACKAAENALTTFEANVNGVDANWVAQQKLIIEMRKTAISATAELINCNADPDTKSSYTCPLPISMTENTAFGNPDVMRDTAIAIHNTTKPKGY